jgi:hypothetical protein
MAARTLCPDGSAEQHRSIRRRLERKLNRIKDDLGDVRYSYAEKGKSREIRAVYWETIRERMAEVRNTRRAKAGAREAASGSTTKSGEIGRASSCLIP